MPSVCRKVRTSAPTKAVFDYLADFSNADEWDSGTVSCERVSGDGGVGTVYRNVSKFMGREVELDYTVERREEPVFEIVGRTGKTISRDTITVVPADGGSEVTYVAEFTFGGATRLLGPLMKLPLKRLADETEKTLAEALERL